MATNIIKIHHADHGIPPEVIQALVTQLNPEGFFLKTLPLPEGTPDVLCGIYGPNMGDAPVPEAEVTYKQRTPDRPMSRMVARPQRPVRIVTLIGTTTPEGVLVFTCYGGPQAEREPGDPSLQNDPAALEAAKRFWSQHALCL